MYNIIEGTAVPFVTVKQFVCVCVVVRGGGALKPIQTPLIVILHWRVGDSCLHWPLPRDWRLESGVGSQEPKSSGGEDGAPVDKGIRGHCGENLRRETVWNGNIWAAQH